MTNEQIIVANQISDDIVGLRYYDVKNSVFGDINRVQANVVGRLLASKGYVKQRKARWKGAGMGDYYCSLCQEEIGGQRKFCPNCGAKMVGELL